MKKKYSPPEADPPLAEKTKKFPCAFCQGKGVQPGAERLSCIVCKGSGRVTVNQPYNICKECGGRGKKAGANLYCLLCQGKGFVEEKRHPLIVESSVPKTRRKKSQPIKKSRSKTRGIKPAAPKIRKAKAEIKKGRKFFFKDFLGTFKIL
ncbi:MAG: hypothetical protein Q8N21_03145 [bacterium]|nr:hypothetical protein [bacterium]